MNKNSLLYLLNDAPKNSKVLVTTVIDGKTVAAPVTSMFVIKDPQFVFSGEIRIQCDRKHDAFAAFVSMVGVKEGTEENFLRLYAGTWWNHESFATYHFDDKYPGLLSEVRPFINIEAYSEKIFGTDFTAVHHENRIFVFRVRE